MQRTPCTIRMDLFPQAVQLKFLLSRETLEESACWSPHSHMQLKVDVRHCFLTPALLTAWFIVVPHIVGCDWGSNAANSHHPGMGMLRDDFNSFSRPCVHFWHSLPSSHTQNVFGFHLLLSQGLPLTNIRDLNGDTYQKTPKFWFTC